MTIRIISWNVNSVRARLAHVQRLIKEYAPDILCLQETKVRDEQFPRQAMEQLGFCYQYYRGIPSYNGVAILSRVPLELTDAPLLAAAQARHLSVYVPTIDLRLDNVYVPAGGDIPDALENSKFDDKLRFMQTLSAMIDTLPARAMIMGDINIAPGEFDVWSHRQMLKVVSHTPIEIAAFNDLLRDGRLVNVVRHCHPEPEKLHSWWSYRVKKWSADSRGLLLDHALVTPVVMHETPQAHILSAVRGWQEKPSDHAPIVVEW